MAQAAAGYLLQEAIREEAIPAAAEVIHPEYQDLPAAGIPLLPPPE